MAKDNFVSQIADIETDFPQWYTDVVIKTKLVDYGPVKGTMVIRPYGYAIWEHIRSELDRRFREMGVENAYFPMLIPMSFLTKEAEHVEGFAPEVAVVTHAGGAKLEEPLVVRPTSETIIGHMFGKWVESWRDLPLRQNQWCNVMRWEKTTRPFLRTSEFLWQEGHSVFATGEEAEAATQQMLACYAEFCKEVLCMPVLTGRKTEKEKFAGAVATYGMEAMMHDGKSLQAGTTHYMGQNFAKAFEIQFTGREGTLQYGYTMSYGVSTRLIGALIMTHGDARGLVLPPPVAPYEVVIVPIAMKKEGVLDACRALADRLKQAGVRVLVDDSDNSPGWKFNEWEMKGVPLRIELGPRDIEQAKMTVMRRDTLEKTELPLGSAEEGVSALIKDICASLYRRAEARMQTRIVNAGSLDELLRAVDGGNFVRAGWCGERACEDKVKEFAQATARVIDEREDMPTCVCCGKKAKHTVFFARAY